MRVLVRYVLPLFIAVPVAFALLYPHLIRCVWIDRSTDFIRLPDSTELHVHTNATTRQLRQLREHVATARQRIRAFWGGRQGKAILIYCPQQEVYEQYCLGGEGAGCSLGTPWGTSYLVLGPDGNNPDVIAHELCHDELFARLGWWRVKRQIPQWFNEGLALMVDYRFTDPAVWQTDSLSAEDVPPLRRRYFYRTPMLKLTELETTKDFFGGNYRHVMLAYQTAAEEVARWLRLVGAPGVARLSQAMIDGADFAPAYQQLEREGRKKLNNQP
ncbi:hypothetical protein [Spirosoma sp. KUDC1026]|uniref:hypothetical protein n=1 Tax=Spirosoma sp. KUDC1026 TaxID=2745947 RepID=UPI00159BD849|nr:hypothetical protein [Spirosoma sp. KUDC1026]QKZ15244.1 hypothetical protein HU175_22505 [Spirosoma sp. KUDC1026]